MPLAKYHVLDLILINNRNQLAIKKIILSFAEPTAFKSTSGLAAITWSSSESDLSDEDKTAFKSHRDNRYHSRTGRCCNSNILCPEDGASEGKLIIFKRNLVSIIDCVLIMEITYTSLLILSIDFDITESQSFRNIFS